MMKLTIFDFLNSISNEKNDLSNHERFMIDYNPFMINRWLSMTNDSYCIGYAMYLSNKDMDKKSHYKFLLYSLPKKYRKFKRYYGQVNTFEEGLIKLMQMYFEVSESKAIEILPLLNENQIDEIKKAYGGKINGKGRKN